MSMLLSDVYSIIATVEYYNKDNLNCMQKIRATLDRCAQKINPQNDRFFILLESKYNSLADSIETLDNLNNLALKYKEYAERYQISKQLINLDMCSMVKNEINGYYHRASNLNNRIHHFNNTVYTFVIYCKA